MPNLVSLASPSLQISGKIQTGIFPISGFLVNPFMKLGQVTKLDKGNKSMSKKLMMTSCRHIVKSLSFFWFMTNLQQSRSQIQDAWSIKDTFSSTVTCYLTEPEKISNTALIPLLWVKILFLPIMLIFCKKNAGISKNKPVLILKGIFSETTYVYVLSHQISSF